MKPNLGLSIVMGVVFSIFITSIYILMSTVPALVGQGTAPANPLGDAIVVFFVLSAAFTFIMQELQGAMAEMNKRNRRDDDERKNEGTGPNENNGDIDPR
jgi:hypothetical protein